MPIGRRMKSSISFLFNSWPKSNLNSTNFIFSDYCSQSSQISHQYQNFHFQVLSTEPNNATCHVSSEVYDYPYFIVMIEESASRSCQMASKVSLPSDDANLHIDFPR
jgi:hypothetical protein